MRYYNEVSVFFELSSKKNTIYGQELKDRLKNENMFSAPVIEGS